MRWDVGRAEGMSVGLLRLVRGLSSLLLFKLYCMELQIG